MQEDAWASASHWFREGSRVKPELKKVPINHAEINCLPLMMNQPWVSHSHSFSHLINVSFSWFISDAPPCHTDWGQTGELAFLGCLPAGLPLPACCLCFSCASSCCFLPTCDKRQEADVVIVAAPAEMERRVAGKSTNCCCLVCISQAKWLIQRAVFFIMDGSGSLQAWLWQILSLEKCASRNQESRWNIQIPIKE